MLTLTIQPRKADHRIELFLPPSVYCPRGRRNSWPHSTVTWRSTERSTLRRSAPRRSPPSSKTTACCRSRSCSSSSGRPRWADAVRAVDPQGGFVSSLNPLTLRPGSALHRVRVPLRRPRPPGGHSQWLHLLAAQVRPPSQLAEPRVLPREAHLEEGTSHSMSFLSVSRGSNVRDGLTLDLLSHPLASLETSWSCSRTRSAEFALPSLPAKTDSFSNPDCSGRLVTVFPAETPRCVCSCLNGDTSGQMPLGTTEQNVAFTAVKEQFV